MGKDSKKLFIFIGVVLLLVCGYFLIFMAKDLVLNENNKAEENNLPHYNYTGKLDHNVDIDDEAIDRIINSNDLENEIKNTDDMEDKLGFLPPIIEKTQSNLRLVLVSYTGKNKGYIDKKLEETPKEDVKGIRFLYFSKDPNGASEVWLICRESDDTHEIYAEDEQVKEEEYKGKNIVCGEKYIILVNDENYEMLSSGNSTFDYMSDPENNNEFTPFTICEWNSGGIDYKLMGKYISDKDLMIKYAKEFIDEMPQ